MVLSKPLIDGRVHNVTCKHVSEHKHWNKDMLVAYDAFLWSEEIRHQEDIAAIRKKREVLHECGFKADEPGPWIDISEILDSVFGD